MSAELADGPDPSLPTKTLAEIEEEIARRRADVSRYQERLAELARQNDEVRRDIEQKATVLHDRESIIKARIITLCRLGRGGYMQLLRGAESWSALFRRSQLVRSVIEGDLRVLREHQEQVEILERQRQALDQRIAAQQELTDRIALYQQELEAEVERRANERFHRPPPVEPTIPY